MACCDKKETLRIVPEPVARSEQALQPVYCDAAIGMESKQWRGSVGAAPHLVGQMIAVRFRVDHTTRHSTLAAALAPTGTQNTQHFYFFPACLCTRQRCTTGVSRKRKGKKHGMKSVSSSRKGELLKVIEITQINASNVCVFSST